MIYTYIYIYIGIHNHPFLELSKVCGLVDDLSVPCDFSAQLLRYAVSANAQQVLQGLQEAKRRLLAQAGRDGKLQ